MEKNVDVARGRKKSSEVEMEVEVEEGGDDDHVRKSLYVSHCACYILWR